MPQETVRAQEVVRLSLCLIFSPCVLVVRTESFLPDSFFILLAWGFLCGLASRLDFLPQDFLRLGSLAGSRPHFHCLLLLVLQSVSFLTDLLSVLP